jgi:hypothetical protein
MFSRNASSSRAIPVERLIQDVLDDPYIPIFWGMNQKGMQAFREGDEPVELARYTHNHGGIRCEMHKVDKIRAWLHARDQAVTMARAFANAGYHKQIVNRLLEPFGHITVVITSTNWSNFLALRDHKDAEPNIQLLARQIRQALDVEPQVLQPGQWHMPFVSHDEWKHEPGQEAALAALENAKKLSVARCASTSYRTTDGFEMTLERAEALYEKLISTPIHASPFEHIVQMDTLRPERGITNGDSTHLLWKHPHLGGNLGQGFIQLRKTLPDECA